MHGTYNTSKSEAKLGTTLLEQPCQNGRTENRYNKLKGIPNIYCTFSGIVLNNMFLEDEAKEDAPYDLTLGFFLFCAVL